MTPRQENEGILWYGFGIVALDSDLPGNTDIPGMEDSLCQIIQTRDLGMLTSEVPNSMYNEAALSRNLHDLAWVEACAVKHEQALLEIMELTTVIPLPFCTIFTSEEHIREQLEHNHDQFRREIDRLRGYHEMQLRLLVNPQLLHEHLIKADRDSKYQGGNNYLLRRQWEKNLEMAEEQLIGDHGESLYQALKRIAKETRLQGLEESAREDGLRVIFTAWFLVADKDHKPWNEQIQAFDEETDIYGFVVEIAGPFPPYHFTSEEEDSSGGDSQ